MSQINIKQGATAPAVAVELLNGDGTVPDLVGATVKFVVGLYGKPPIVESLATIEDTATGLVSYTWSPSDTAVAGNYIAEWHVSYADGSDEIFPSKGYIFVQIEGALT